jgi:hypothetical protein
MAPRAARPAACALAMVPAKPAEIDLAREYYRQIPGIFQL